MLLIFLDVFVFWHDQQPKENTKIKNILLVTAAFVEESIHSQNMYITVFLKEAIMLFAGEFWETVILFAGLTSSYCKRWDNSFPKNMNCVLDKNETSCYFFLLQALGSN